MKYLNYITNNQQIHHRLELKSYTNYWDHSFVCCLFILNISCLDKIALNTQQSQCVTTHWLNILKLNYKLNVNGNEAFTNKRYRATQWIESQWNWIIIYNWEQQITLICHYEFWHWVKCSKCNMLSSFRYCCWIPVVSNETN